MDTNFLSRKDYALHRNVSVQYINKLFKERRLVMSGKLVDVAATDALLDDNADPRGGSQLSDTDLDSTPTSAQKSTYMLEKTREARWSAENKRLRTLKDAGELVEVKTVEREAFNQARLLRDALLNLPDRLSASLAAESDPLQVHAALTKEVRVLCNDLADGTGVQHGH